MELLKHPVVVNNRIILCQSLQSDQEFTIMNVDQHSGPIYCWRNPKIGAENDNFLYVYSGNVNIENEDIAVVILKAKPNSFYLITADNLGLYLKIR